METVTASTAIPQPIAQWLDALQPEPLARVVPDPARAALFSADMVEGFCRQGALASPRVGALAAVVEALFRRLHRHGVGHFVLLQDTHDPQAPEFEAWPPHCVRGTRESSTIPELRGLPFSDRFTLIEKNSIHPGLNTGFDRWLEEHPEIRTAVVVGNCTDLCVYQLAMHLRLRANALNLAGFEVIVPANAVQTYDLPAEEAPEGGPPASTGTRAGAHPGDFFHGVFLYHMALNGITVVKEIV